MSRFVVGGRANPGGEGDVGEGEAEEAEGAAVSRETLLSSGGALILPSGRARSISRAGAQNASAAHLLVLACHARAPPSLRSSRSNSPPPPRPPPAASSSGGALILPGCRARSVSRSSAPWGWARTGSGCRPSGWRRRGQQQRARGTAAPRPAAGFGAAQRHPRACARCVLWPMNTRDKMRLSVRAFGATRALAVWRAGPFLVPGELAAPARRKVAHGGQR